MVPMIMALVVPWLMNEDVFRNEMLDDLLNLSILLSQQVV
jgi:hypothetical protein